MHPEITFRLQEFYLQQKICAPFMFICFLKNTRTFKYENITNFKRIIICKSHKEHEQEMIKNSFSTFRCDYKFSTIFTAQIIPIEKKKEIPIICNGDGMRNTGISWFWTFFLRFIQQWNRKEHSTETILIATGIHLCIRYITTINVHVSRLRCDSLNNKDWLP